jgi:hydrogenase maturation protein HypF
MKALLLHVTGIVQGVGFRPFVYNLALESGLSGWVLNASDGVHLAVEGPSEIVDAFPDRLRERAPAMAHIERITFSEVETEGFTGFEIRSSRAEQGAMTLVSPDIATCPECLAELRDPADRRYGYPFINCTNCGPRFTIIDDVPYDRPTTTMRDFPMCPQCAEEYGDPRDRRFHAQPDACFICGPRLYLNVDAANTDGSVPTDWPWSPDCEQTPRPHRLRDSESERSAAIVNAAAGLLRGGGVLAIKGLGGFHLACDATDPIAVNTLRSRKNRWAKPLAVMVPNLAAARELCEVGDTEAALLSGTVRPIVLLRRHADTSERDTSQTAEPLAEGVANGLSEMGMMLPYTPLHHLLLDAVGRPLVMTSGNLSDEPIATDNREALDRLGSIADGFLLHDRDIRCRYDDSVVRVVGDIVEPVRRSRGYAPHPLKMPFSTDTAILAAGPEQKNTFTLLTGEYAFVSQHIGDMENAETLESFDATIALYKRLFRVDPHLIAHDSHPEYLSTKWALEQGLPTIDVQHHHAHIASVTAEHGLAEKVVGVAFDGTGYGADGRIWGGEFLICDWTEYERFAHLRYVPMPGGAGAIRRPARMALGTLSVYGLLDHPGAAPLLSRLADGEQRTITAMIEHGLNCPLTSSMGRLFDTVAALTGVADDAGYEGEAAILLEAAADPSAPGAYSFEMKKPEQADSPIIIDAGSLLAAILSDIVAGVTPGVVSMRFHRAVVECIVAFGAAAAARCGTTTVALAGGVFMNRLVLEGAVKELDHSGLMPLTHVSLPLNDGAISLGQAVVAWARRQDR